MAREQKTKKNPENNCYGHYDDELDLFELFQKIWKWKWLITSVVIFSILLTFIYNLYNIKSDSKAKFINWTYTAQTIIKIGCIGGQAIDSFTYNSPTITNISKIIEKKYSKRINIPTQIVGNKGSKIEIDFKSDNNKINFNVANFSLKIEPASGIHYISIISKNAESSLEILEYILKLILQEHKKIYTNGVNKLNKNIAYFKSKQILETNIYFSIPYLLDSFNYQSEIISNPILPSNPDIDSMPERKLTQKLALAFIASLLLGIFLSLFIDFVIAHKRKTS
jgi:hypothetical protein